MSNWEKLNSTLPEESLANQYEQLAVAVKLLAKMGIHLQVDENLPSSQGSLPRKSVLIVPRKNPEKLGVLSLFADNNSRPMMYLEEPADEMVKKRSPEYFIHAVLKSFLDPKKPQFQIIPDMEKDLTAVKIVLPSDRFSEFETIGRGDRAVGLIFYSPQLVTTLLHQPLIVGTVGFLTLPTESSQAQFSII